MSSRTPPLKTTTFEIVDGNCAAVRLMDKVKFYSLGLAIYDLMLKF